RYLGASPGSLAELLENDPPAAILVGLEGDLDQPLLDYAVRHHYQETNLPGFPGALYLRP
ncbi:MAG: hypothetical protein VB089_06885, partial [Anaerolineaceae bacterium]|nr:hypothetical protein [Anaerolineaceae bacterium]